MKKQVRAVAGATLVMPVMASSIVIGYTAWYYELSWSGREFLTNPIVLLVLTFLLMVPVSLAVVVVLAFLTRYFARRGSATFWRVTLVGTALGTATPLPLILQRLLDAARSPLAPGIRPYEALAIVLGTTLVGAISGAVYWALLHPPSHYPSVSAPER